MTARRVPYSIVAIFVVYSILAGSLALTKRPWADEAWFANISVNILEHGKTGISVLDPKGNANMLGREFPDINEHFYIWIPVQQSVNALWYRVIGFGVFRMRLASLMWGLLALASLMMIVMRLTGERYAALLTGLFTATDFAFLDAASDGRMDMMCAALSLSAIALFLALRGRALRRAVFCSQLLAVAAGLTHPMGAIGFVMLASLTLALEYKRVRFPEVGAALLAYVIGAGVAAAYILPGLDLFRAQLGGALTGRVGVATSAGSTFLREITVKYANFYAPAYSQGAARLRLMIPVMYGLSLISALFFPACRRTRGRVVLLGLAMLSLLTMAFLDSGKMLYYLVHSTPWLAAAAALFTLTLWHSGKRPLRAAALMCGGALLLLQMAWVAGAVRKDPYGRSFQPMASFVRKQIAEQRQAPYRVTSSAELGFATGFDPAIFEDDALVGYGSHRASDLIVFDQRAYGAQLEGFERNVPAIAGYIHRLLAADFHVVYDDGYYKVYARNVEARNDERR